MTRKRRRETKPIRIDVISRERLDALKAVLERLGLPEYVDQVDIVPPLASFDDARAASGSLPLMALYSGSTRRLKKFRRRIG